MKILIITMNVGKTAPGIVFEKLIKGLSSLHDIDLLVADFEPSIELPNVSNVVITKRYNIHPRISRLLISIFTVNPFDYFWSLKARNNVIDKTNIKYDCIISFIDGGNYAAVLAGNYFSQKYGIRHAVHTTDAIPAPVGWLKNDMFYRGLKKMMARYLNQVDAFFSTNHQMLNYQLNTFTPKKHLISNVIYTPGLPVNKEFPIPVLDTNDFVYTGNIYGVRRADYILEGFEKLLEVYPKSQLIFIGSHFSTISLFEYKPETLERINFIPYTSDLDVYYSRATALIDIDADMENDVFISSKMPIYLTINRVIISETGKNSPSRHLFKGIESIIQCDHDADQLCDAMKKSIEEKRIISFDDRKEIIKLFKIENIVDQMNLSLKQMITSKLNIIKSEQYQN